jgi:L-galactose dehydrogenase
METRELGQTGLRVSPIAFGAAPVGSHYGEVATADAVAAVRHAIDRGINFIDTSPYYGLTRSETVLGQALSGGYRNRVILSTKAGRNDSEVFDFSAKAMLASLDASLSRLRTDYVDVFFAHDIEFAADFEFVFTETYAALQTAREAGKCRFIGMTGYPPGLFAAAIERCRLDVVLNYCHFALVNTQMLSRLLPAAERHGTALVNASPLMMGLFSSKGPPPWHPAPKDLVDACGAAVHLCHERGADPEVLALQFVLREPRIPCTFVGMSSVAEVDMNLRALDAPIDEGLLADVRAVLAPVFDTEWPSGNWPTGA